MISKESSPAQSHKKRLFFALWPDEAVVQQIKQHAISYFEHCQGRILQAHNWHMTLAYFGAADSETQVCMEQQAQSISAQPFELEIQLSGFWPRPQVAWLAPKETPQPLRQLVRDLEQGLIPCGYTPESRAYQPHITLVRKAKQPPSVIELEPIKMKVRQFCLVESQTSEQGANYQVLRCWDFATEAL